MKKISFMVVMILMVGNLAFAEETSFGRIAAPDSKGKLTKAILTLSDDHKAVEVHLAKNPTVSIPYSEIDKFTYEYTKKRRINEESVLTAPVGGAIVMLTKAKSHWLKIDYRQENLPRCFVLRMDKHEYLHILEALKAHTGKDAEILGNADKR